MADLQRAIEIAVRAHAGQFREGEHPLPYIAHPFDVLRVLRDVGGVTDERLWIVAMLHDVIEDSCVGQAELEAEFDPQIIQWVVELTRTEPEPEQLIGLTKPEIWQLRADLLLGDIQERMSPEAWTIKLADRASNLDEARRTKSPEKLKRYCAHTQLILQAISRSTNPALWDRVKELSR